MNFTKGSLISEGFSLWLQSPKTGVKSKCKDRKTFCSSVFNGFLIYSSLFYSTVTADVGDDAKEFAKNALDSVKDLANQAQYIYYDST